MRDDETVRLRHKPDAATEALGFTRALRREDLEHDRQLARALAKAIEIPGDGGAFSRQRCKVATGTGKTIAYS